ncbi:sigma-70 family RNA polymerase sigma factor [Rhizobium sp. Root1220]|uniref:sigma-70 family RNA polymerase sigma factor n=1 Tax=Rhizobium sp. Root1220 TaxID=1736432 RepID=UPI0006F97007|nr:sigma-70 family RNA polymerase sigma factor [Rhizobium sp. Root1220]KQV83476.1 RNA polymerase subunit sigma-24 [Rhizobium sp. Root1220]
MMTDAQITYFPGSIEALLRLHWPRQYARPSPVAALLGATGRLFQLMAPAKAQPAFADPTGDAAVQRPFMQRFQDMIVPHLDAAYNFARFLSRDADAAQDIVQEAFLRAYRSFGSYHGGDPRAWLFAIVRNCCHAWRQQDRRKSRFEQPMNDEGGADTDEAGEREFASEEDTPETATIRRSEQQRVRDVISRLPEAMREILVLRELADLSYREIADIIDAPIGTVMSRLARARREFSEAWGACLGSEAAR